MRGEVAIPFKLITIINIEKKYVPTTFFFLVVFPQRIKTTRHPSTHHLLIYSILYILYIYYIYIYTCIYE